MFLYLRFISNLGSHLVRLGAKDREEVTAVTEKPTRSEESVEKRFCGEKWQIQTLEKCRRKKNAYDHNYLPYPDSYKFFPVSRVWICHFSPQKLFSTLFSELVRFSVTAVTSSLSFALQPNQVRA